MDELKKTTDEEDSKKWWTGRSSKATHKCGIKFKPQPISKISVLDTLMLKTKHRNLPNYELTKKNKVRGINVATLNNKRNIPSLSNIIGNSGKTSKLRNRDRLLYEIKESSFGSKLFKSSQEKRYGHNNKESNKNIYEKYKKKSVRQERKVLKKDSSKTNKQKIIFQCPSKAKFPKTLSNHFYKKYYTYRSTTAPTKMDTNQNKPANIKSNRMFAKQSEYLNESYESTSSHKCFKNTSKDRDKLKYSKIFSNSAIRQFYAFGKLRKDMDKKIEKPKRSSKLLLGSASSYMTKSLRDDYSVKTEKHLKSIDIVSKWKTLQEQQSLESNSKVKLARANNRILPTTYKMCSNSTQSKYFPKRSNKQSASLKRLVKIPATTVMKVEVKKTHPENVDCVCCTCPSRHYPPEKGDGTAAETATEMDGDNLNITKKSVCVDTKRRHKKGVKDTSATTADGPPATKSTGAGPAPPQAMKSAFHLKKYKRDELRKKKIKFEKTPPTLKEIKNMTEQQIKIKFKAPYIEREEAPEADAEEFRRSVRDKKKLSELYPWLENPTVTTSEACAHVCCRCPDPYEGMTKMGAYPEPGVPFGGGWGSYGFGAGAPGEPGAPGAERPQIAPQELPTKGAYAPGGMYGPPLSYGAKGKFPPAGDWQTQMGAKALPAGWPPPGWVPPGWVPPPGQTPPPWRAPPGWKPPMGWTPPPGSRPPEGWEKPKDWPPIDGSIPKPPTIGRIPPDGWVPPGWKPPPDQKVVKWDPPENWVPPPGWTPPPGSTPPKEFMPPEGWVPPGWKSPPGIKVPVEWTPPPNWIPPPGWTPPKGAIPPPGYLPPAGSKPPPEFYPPEGWVPPGWKPSPAYNPPPKWLPPPMWLPPPDWKPPPGSLPPKKWMPPKKWVPPGWTPRPGMKVKQWNPPPLWFPPNRWKPPAGAKPPPVTVIPPLWEPPEKYQPPVDYLQPAPKGFYYDDDDKLKKTAKFDRQVKKQAKIEKKAERERIMKLKEQGHDYVLTLDAATGKFVLEQKIPDPPPVCTHEKCICQPYTEEELQKMMGENICEENLCTCPTQYKKDAYADNVRIKEMELAAKEAWIRYMEMRRARLAKILAALEPIRRKELAEALKAQIMARRKKAIICKCPLEMTVDEILKSYNSDYRAKFRDKIRLVDFILVLKDDGDPRVEQMCANFLTGALKVGLEIELERGVMPCNSQLVFAKVHAPPYIIEKYGRAFGIRKYFKRHHIYCVPSPEREYVEVARDATPKPIMYSTHDRMMIVNQILMHLPYGTDTFDYGYHRLVSKHILRDGFALHDGPYFFVSNQVADKAQLRQILYYNWAAPWFVCFRTCPILMIQEYMGERAASFFLFYSYYNQALFVLSAMAFLCSIFLGIAPFVYSSVKKSVFYACGGELSGMTLCPYCTDFDLKWCDLKTVGKNYCITNVIDNILDNSVMIMELYSILLILWAIFVPYAWKYKERKITWLWECNTATSNSQCNYIRMRIPQIIKQVEDNAFFVAKQVITGIVIFIFMGLFIATLFMNIWIFRYARDGLIFGWINMIFKEPDIQIIRLMLMLFNGIIFAAISCAAGILVKHIVYLLTHLEKHTLFMHYERHIVVRYTFITLITSLGYLVYQAYFHGIGYRSPIEKCQFLFIEYYYHICGPFNICLHEILVAYLCVMIIKQFLIPSLWWASRIVTCNKTCCTKYPAWERELLLAPLTEKMIMDRYDYIIDQFAFLVTFGIVFPLATIPCLLCNCWDYNYTARLFLMRHRRALLPRFAGIGTVRGALLTIGFMTIWLHAGMIAWQTKIAERHVYRAYSHTYKNTSYLQYLGVNFTGSLYKNKTLADPEISKNYSASGGTDAECFAPIQYRMTMFLEAYQTDIKDFHNKFGKGHPQKWACGSECYAVMMTKCKIFILYVLFMHSVVWLIASLFGTSSRVRQVRVAEAKILSAIVRGDRRRSRKSVVQDFSTYCPNC